MLRTLRLAYSWARSSNKSLFHNSVAYLMWWIDDYSESENQDVSMNADWLEVYHLFTLVIAWLSGSPDCPSPHYLTEYR